MKKQETGNIPRTAEDILRLPETRIDQRAGSLSIIGKGIRKKDSMQLLLGKPLFTEDIAPQDCLVVKLVRSPHANAIVRTIRTDAAL